MRELNTTEFSAVSGGAFEMPTNWIDSHKALNNMKYTTEQWVKIGVYDSIGNAVEAQGSLIEVLEVNLI